MENNELAERLIKLVQLDIDAVHAYTQAIDQIDISEVKDELIKFRGDHERHIEDLSPLILDLGSAPPEFKPDFKGYLIQGMTALRSSTGTQGALKAMKTNEELTNKKYEEAVVAGFPPAVSAVVEKNRDDERRHLEYISHCIAIKIWETPGAGKVA